MGTLHVHNAHSAPLVNGLGGPSGFGENSLIRNDDGAFSVDVSSVFSNGLNFFGTNYSNLWINNNGNITFENGLSTFTPFALTENTSNPIIAPFFADVDTRNEIVDTNTPGGNSTASNLVWYDLDITSSIFTVTWDDVGFYEADNSLLNAFQLQLRDRSNVAPGDFDICFIYEAINWTTGDASGGANGFGGTVARAGWNSGNGTDFFELPESGNEADILDLDSSGKITFEVRNGTVAPPVIDPQVIPVPAAVWLLGAGLIPVLRRKK